MFFSASNYFCYYTKYDSYVFFFSFGIIVKSVVCKFAFGIALWEKGRRAGRRPVVGPCVRAQRWIIQGVLISGRGRATDRETDSGPLDHRDGTPAIFSRPLAWSPFLRERARLRSQESPVSCDDSPAIARLPGSSRAPCTAVVAFLASSFMWRDCSVFDRRRSTG